MRSDESLHWVGLARWAGPAAQSGGIFSYTIGFKSAKRRRLTRYRRGITHSNVSNRSVATPSPLNGERAGVRGEAVRLERVLRWPDAREVTVQERIPPLERCGAGPAGQPYP
jgi:hypothetical protein